MESIVIDALLLLLAVVVSGWVARALPIKIPLPLMQMAAGGLVAATTGFGFKLDPDLFFLLFLPPLLFLDGWRVPKAELRREAHSIASLALGLVIFSVIGIGYLAHWLMPSMPLPVAFALAAALSPTDAVAVGAILERSPVPRKLLSVLEGEALLNDASGLVCMRFAVAAAVTGGFALGSAALTFLWLAGAGLAIGILTTLAITRVQEQVRHQVGEEAGASILLGVLVPFAAYLFAESVQASGILAAVAAGMTMAHTEQSGQNLAVTRVRGTAVWDMIGFALNGAMFVLVGEQLPEIVGTANAALQDHLYGPMEMFAPVIVLTLGLLAIRFVWVWAVLWLRPLVLLGQPISTLPGGRFLAVAAVAGARGSLTLVAIMTLPLTLDGAPFPARDLAIGMAAGVVVLSMAIAGATLPSLTRGLNATPEDDRSRFERRARQAAALAAIDAIEKEQHDAHSISTGSVDWMEAAARISGEYRTRIERLTENSDSASALQRTAEIEQDLRLVALRAERATYFRLGRQGKLDDDIVRDLVAEVDELENRIDRRALPA